MQKPTPAWDWNNLGYTHTVGTFDDSQGSAYNDIIKNTTDQQTERQKLFRNKVSVHHKTYHHRNYTINPINSPEALGYLTDASNPLANTKGIFDASLNNYLPIPFVNRYKQDAENNDTLDELDKSYFFSTKLLSYLYLKTI